MQETVAPPKYRFGPYEADFQRRELRKFGTRIKIQTKPLAVLEVLIRNHGELISRDQLREALWPNNDVFVDFDKNLGTAVNKLRDALCDSAEQHRYIETVPRFGYRFSADVEIVDDSFPIKTITPAEPLPPVQTNRKHRWVLVAVVCAASVLIAVSFVLLENPPKANSNNPTVVIADFENFTGEQVFNGPLRQALSVQLKESPVLLLLSDGRIAEDLTLMERPKDSPVIGSVASEICQRSGSVARVEGSISSLGAQYVLVLKATNCSNEETLVQEQITADRKEKVLDSLTVAAARLRRKLDESLQSIERPTAVPEAVTTSSFQALQSYSLGFHELAGRNEALASIKFFQRAIELDPNFAMAYANLGVSYGNIADESLAVVNLEKAYAQRDRVSQSERFYILARYDQFVTGDSDAIRNTLELWSATYPNDPMPHSELGDVYTSAGNHERALIERQKALKMSGSVWNYGSLVANYVALHRMEEAQKTALEAVRRGADSPYLQLSMYHVAVLEHDYESAKSINERLIAIPGFESASLEEASNTSALLGRFAESRAFTRRATDSAKRTGQKDAAAFYLAEASLRESLTGNLSLARQNARDALTLSDDKDVVARVALALAISGDRSTADRLANKLEEKFPRNTAVHYNYLPCVRAASALATHDSVAAVAITTLAAPYELGTMGMPLHPIYLRGLSYLHLGDSIHSVEEFQKVLNSSAIVPNSVLRPMAQLGIARAYILAGDTPKAKAAYDKFFTFWKDADPNIPALKAAKEEFSRLQ